MPDIRIRIGNRILDRADYLREQSVGTDPAVTTAIKQEAYHPHGPTHVGNVMQPKQPTGVVSTKIIECRRDYMAKIREELLRHLLTNRYEFQTITDIHATLKKSGVKASRNSLLLEIENIKHALASQGVFGTTQANHNAQAYKYTGTIKDSDIPGLIESYLPEVTKAAALVSALRREQKRPPATVASLVGTGQTVRVAAPADVTQTINLKLMVEVCFKVRLQED